MLIGDVHTRNPPESPEINRWDNGKPAQPVQWTCPRNSHNPPSWPANSDGYSAGMAAQGYPTVEGGAGFPLYPCDKLGSPLRQDIHFPSCYNPKVGLDDYKNNMAWPKQVGYKENCPEGYIHVPHLFYEVYWDTPAFDGLWTPDGKNQPFVLSNGDATGYSSHADFIAGWDEHTLQVIIDTCDAGSIGMDKCPQIPGGLNYEQNCKIEPAIPEQGISLASNNADQKLSKLPGNNPVTGWGKGGVSKGSVAPASESSSSDSKPQSDSGSAAPAEAPAPASNDKESSAPAAPVAQAVSDSADKINLPGAGDVAGSPVVDAVETVWDVVTVVATETAYAQPARRSENHRHGHMARHARHAGRS